MWYSRAVCRTWAWPVFPLQGFCWGMGRRCLLCDPGHGLEVHDWWLCRPAQYDPSKKRIFCLVSWRLGCMGPLKSKQKLRPLWESCDFLGEPPLRSESSPHLLPSHLNALHRESRMWQAGLWPRPRTHTCTFSSIKVRERKIPLLTGIWQLSGSHLRPALRNGWTTNRTQIQMYWSFVPRDYQLSPEKSCPVDLG